MVRLHSPLQICGAGEVRMWVGTRGWLSLSLLLPEAGLLCSVSILTLFPCEWRAPSKPWALFGKAGCACSETQGTIRDASRRFAVPIASGGNAVNIEPPAVDFIATAGGCVFLGCA